MKLRGIVYSDVLRTPPDFVWRAGARLEIGVMCAFPQKKKPTKAQIQRKVYRSFRKYFKEQASK